MLPLASQIALVTLCLQLNRAIVPVIVTCLMIGTIPFLFLLPFTTIAIRVSYFFRFPRNEMSSRAHENQSRRKTKSFFPCFRFSPTRVQNARREHWYDMGCLSRRYSFSGS